MRVPGAKTLRLSSLSAASWLHGRFVRGGLILAYHRVSETRTDPFGLCVSPERFMEHVAVLRAHATPMRLAELVAGIGSSMLPRKSVAVTFDDGYADNLYNAKPILAQYGVPATVFVTTGSLGKTFWWDELDGAVGAVEAVIENLERLDGEPPSTRALALVRSVGPRRYGTDRRTRVVRALHRMLNDLPTSERAQALDQLRHPDARAVEPQFQRGCSEAEIAELAEGNLVEIGAHTVSHPSLAMLPMHRQRTEILESKAVLERLLQRPVSSFSYPFGSVTDTTRAIVREAGFGYACCSSPGIACQGSDSFRLPRVWIPNWSGKQFHRWLNRWFCGAR